MQVPFSELLQKHRNKFRLSQDENSLTYDKFINFAEKTKTNKKINRSGQKSKPGSQGTTHHY